MTKLKKQYTLIEILTVIAIIAILTGLIIPSVNLARERARETALVNGANVLATALRQYKLDYSKFPNIHIPKGTNDIYTPVGGVERNHTGDSYGKNYYAKDKFDSFKGKNQDTSSTASVRSLKYDNIVYALSGIRPGSLDIDEDKDNFSSFNRKKTRFIEVSADYMNGYSYSNMFGYRYYIVYGTENVLQFYRPDNIENAGISSNIVKVGSDVAVFCGMMPKGEYNNGSRLATSWGGIQDYE